MIDNEQKSRYIQDILKSCMPPIEIGKRLNDFKWKTAEKYATDQSFSQYILQKRKKDNIKHFCDSYRNVKSDRKHWPECNSLDDWYNLPDYIKEECLSVHEFSPEQYIINSGDENFFTPDLNSLRISENKSNRQHGIPETGFDILKILQTKHNILDNIEIIKNAVITELAAGDGVTSATALYLGAKSAIVTDIADINLDHCRKIKQLFKYGDNFRIKKSDICDFKSTSEQCMYSDVVLLQNILSIIENKTRILESIASGFPKHIIVSDAFIQHEPQNNSMPLSEKEKKENESFINSSLPLVKYHTSKCSKLQSPYWSRHHLGNFENIKSEPTITIQFPNIAWYDLAFEKLGYARTKYKIWCANPFYMTYDNAFTAVYTKT